MASNNFKKLDVYKNVNKKSQYIIKDIDVSIINAIRRIILSELTIPAFDDKNINIIKNTGVLVNDIIAQRISLIPVHFNKKEIKNFDPTNYVFKLNVENNLTNKNTLVVTTKDIQVYDKDGNKYPDNIRNKLLPPNDLNLYGSNDYRDYIIITKLKPDLYGNTPERLEIEFTASMGTGITHARWCPVSLCVCYNNFVENNEENINISQRKFVIDEYGEATEFVFAIESECGLTPDDLLEMAFELLNKKIDDVIKSIKDNTITIEVLKEGYYFLIEFKNESHTLLNVIQSLIYNRHFKSSIEKSGLEYIGYYQSHPHDSNIMLKIKFKDGSNQNIKKFMDNEMKHIKNLLQSIWKKK